MSQPHFNSSWQDLHASLSVVQNGCHMMNYGVQPHSAGSGYSVARTCMRAWPQTYPAWNAALYMCWRRAAEVGGMKSIVRPFLVNRSLRASSTSTQTAVLSYRRTTNLSKLQYAFAVLALTEVVCLASQRHWQCLGRVLMFSKLFPPLFWKKEVLSHPVKARNIMRAIALSFQVCSRWCVQWSFGYSQHRITPTVRRDWFARI